MRTMNELGVSAERPFIRDLLPVRDASRSNGSRSTAAKGVAIGCVFGVAVWIAVGLAWVFWF